MTTAEYARLEERILARDQVGASRVLYGLLKQGRSLTEITGETVRIHAPYTHVPYHQRLDDGVCRSDVSRGPRRARGGVARRTRAPGRASPARPRSTRRSTPCRTRPA